LGYTVQELLERISSRELSEWAVFYQQEPFGQEADWLGSAIVASTVANANRGKGQKAFEAYDFMPKPGAQKKKAQSPEEMLQFAAMFTLAAGGKDERE
jgi:hypothetical protein